MPKNKEKFITLGVLFGIFAFCLGVGAFDQGGETALGDSVSTETQPLQLPMVGDVASLKQLLKDCGYEEGKYLYTPTNDRGLLYTMNDMAKNAPVDSIAANDMAIMEMAEAEVSMAAAPTAAAAAPTATAEGSGYSQTNVQVAGVDEADLVKTDGKYIYKVDADSVQIIQAVPATQMKLVAEISYDSTSFNAQEIYIDQERLVLIGEYWQERKGCFPYWCGWDAGTRIALYDLSDIAHPRLMRQADIDGSKISTRKVGDYLYFGVSQSVSYTALDEGRDYLPRYEEQTFGSLGEKTVKKEIPLQEIAYFPNCIQPQYLMVGAMQVRDLTQPLKLSSYLADGSALYATNNEMYVALTNWNYAGGALKMSSSVPNGQISTEIYRFGLDKMKVVCNGKGSVPGEILNQFSMDKYDNYFRIATTTGYAWGTGESAAQNNLYVLDADLKQVGALTGIAPGETIYSVRFMGKKAYMVTFRTVDPFFVLDLSQPSQPKILGQLKIPGYSDYLHPYDENHILGFGKETVEICQPGEDTPGAYYLGMKVSLFDVTDVAHPVEIDKVVIGDRGTSSELLQDHKALLFEPENLLAFPVTVYSLPAGKSAVVTENGYSYAPYGDFSYQGAYIYRLKNGKGFNLQGTITHLSDEDYAKAGDYWYDDGKNIRRILYIDNQFYTVSDDKIKANRMDNLQEIASLDVSK